MTVAPTSVDGKITIVTGASGGMGRAITLGFAAAGAKVVAGDVAADAGEAVAEEARAAGGDVVFVAADVSQAADVEALVAATIERHGRLDSAVNAAAIEFEMEPLADCADDDFDRMIAINLRGVFLSCKHELRAMVRGGNGGSIVNIASTNAFNAGTRQPAYTASKHGVLGLTKSAAADYARHGIRVNAICPGAIDTPMLRNAMERRGNDPDEVVKRLSKLHRFGDPDEIAAAALWLCSDASSFTTGTALAVDGGMLTG